MRRLLVLLALGVMATAGNAAAAPPSNDTFENATVAQRPFASSVDLSQASVDSGEAFGCASISGSVWYTLASPTDETVRIDLTGSGPGVFANIYRSDGPGLSQLTFLDCAYWFSSRVLTLEAGETYYVQGARDGSTQFATLALGITEVPRPSNDDITDARIVAGLPYADEVDTSGATVEDGEPPLCTPPPSTRTVWYAFTPTADLSLAARVENAYFAPVTIGVYAGSPGALSVVACNYVQAPTFRARSGMTYYFQVGSAYGGGSMRFVLETAPDPSASFWFSPADPSVFDLVQFYDQSYDPVWAGWRSWHWNFGDGTSSNQSYPTHQWAADGDYAVVLTVETVDGRQATTTQTVRVRTHDVGIGAFEVPTSGRPLRTKLIAVGVSNRRYQENVTVQLYRSVPGGDFQLVGSSTQLVKVRAGYKTTPFVFSYTFTEQDGAAGKVTFKAVAVIEGARDALPADNTVIAPATKVR